MTTSAISKMHGDHQAWRAENAFWHDQLREWQQQTEEALHDLESVRAMFFEHQRKLQVHASAVKLYDQTCAQHEHELAQAESGSTAVRDTSDHKTETWDHTHQRERHEACKLQHHSLIARWKMLLASLKSGQ